MTNPGGKGLSGVTGWSQKNYWTQTVVTFLVFLIAVAALNITVDPFGIFGIGLYPPITDNRYLHMRVVLEECEPPPECLIIGSSRVECLDEDRVTELTGYKCVNCWGPGATPEIYTATLRMALEEFGFPIRLVIVGAEPGILLGENKGVHPQARILLSFQRYLSKIPEWSVCYEMVCRVFSWENTLASVAVITSRPGEDRAEGNIYGLPDREAMLNGWGGERGGSETFQAELDYRLHQLEDFGKSEFCRARTESWDEFLNLCTANDIKIYAFTQPAHPDLVDAFYYHGAEEVYGASVSYLEESVLSSGGTFRKYIYPVDFGGATEHFRDMVHMERENGDLLLADLLSDFGS